MNTRANTTLSSLSIPAFIPALVTGFVCACIVYGLLAYAHMFEQKQQEEEYTLQSMALTQAAISYTWANAQSLADHVASQISEAYKEQDSPIDFESLSDKIPAILERYTDLWPGSGLTLYNGAGELIFISRFGQAPTPLAQGPLGAAPLASTIREAVTKAVGGTPGRAYTRYRGFVSISVAAPVQAGIIRALVVSVPLDSFTLDRTRDISQSDVAVLPVEGDRLDAAAAMLSLAGGSFKSTLPDLVRQLDPKTAPQQRLYTTRNGEFIAAVVPLRNHEQEPLGFLLTTPTRLAEQAPGTWRLFAAAIAGLLGGICTYFGLRRTEGRLGSAIAGRLNIMTDAAQTSGPFPVEKFRAATEDMEETQETGLGASLRKLATLLRRYKAMSEETELAEKIAQVRNVRSILKPGQETSPRGENDQGAYYRLFGALPIGAFQVSADGKLISVNQTFAQLLGYDSPSVMLTECSAFTEFCLYGDELRNPFRALVEERGDGYSSISLRRRDGSVHSYTLIFAPILDARDETPEVIEGFLLDRTLEEQIAKVDRERADARQQRISLALLLAATCRQTTSYLAPQGAEGRRGGAEERRRSDRRGRSFSVSSGTAAAKALPASAEPQDGEEGRPERRKGVASVKAVLSDIYQIAMVEAESMMPVAVPMDFGRFMERLCRQTLPALHSRGISLRCEVQASLLTRINGPAPLLRHALQRAILAVAAHATGGWASFSVMRDPNIPRLPGLLPLLFSASWSAQAPADENGELPPPNVPPIEDGYLIFSAPASILPDPAEKPGEETETGALDFDSEKNVINYLAEKMNGQLREGEARDDLRSMQLKVSLEYLMDVEVQQPAPQELPTSVSQEILGEGNDVLLPLDNAEQPLEAPELPDAPLHIQDLSALVAAPVEDGANAQPGLEMLVMDEHLPEGGIDEDGDAAPMELAILLISGTLNERLQFSRFLRETPHTITEAHDGQEGVEMFQRGPFDVIFMDMQMPLMDGFQATRIIRALEEEKGLPQTPIVGMTTYALPEFRQQCALSGCTEFLAKPFTRNALLGLLHAFIILKEDAADRASAVL